MDIAKVQKFNEMAVYLQKHNIVQDRNSALKNAEKIYGIDDNITKKEVVEMTDDDPDELRKDVRKIAFALRDALNEIKDLKSQMGKMESQFSSLIVNQRPRERPVQQVVQTPMVNQAQERQEAPQQQPVQTKFSQSEKKIECPIDRNNVAPSDVAIEKMFYFGNK